MTKTMKKKGLFARMTALAMACAMALSVAAGAVDDGTYTATLLKEDGTTSHSNSLISGKATVDGNTVTVKIVPFEATYGTTTYVGFASTAKCDGADITLSATGETLFGYDVQTMTITATDEALESLLSEGGLAITFTSNTYKVNEGDDDTLTHTAASTAYLALS